MGIRTVLLYLFGSRRAILTLAASRWTLVVGFCFVISAAFAREYDGKDLIAEPWHIVVPAGVSLVTSLVFFYFVWFGRAICRKDDLETRTQLAQEPPSNYPGFLSAYGSFLGLFWMTAPLAWLYAVPYERILDPLGATHANLWTLGLVSVWRVAILIRVFVVLLGFTAWGAAITVLVIADAIALFSLRVLPVSVLQLMGGVRVSDRESLIQSFGMNIFCIGGCSLPILLLMTFGILAATRVRWAAPTSLSAKSRRPSLPLWLVCFWSLAVWPLILPMTQPEQQLRSHAEKLLINHDVEGSLAFMSAHQQDEFPPHWDPPIRQRGLDFLCKTFNAMEKQPAAPWVRALYVNMLREELQYWFRYENHHEKDKLSTLLNTVPEATAIVAEFRAIDEDRARAIFKPHVENWEMSRPEASR